MQIHSTSYLIFIVNHSHTVLLSARFDPLSYTVSESERSLKVGVVIGRVDSSDLPEDAIVKVLIKCDENHYGKSILLLHRQT